MQRAPPTTAASARASCSSSAARRRPSSTRCGARSPIAGRSPPPSSATAARRAAPGGAGATASSPSNGCSAPAKLTTATRRGTFERVYDLTERVLPAAILGAADAVGRGRAARAAAPCRRARWASATEFDLRDYFRLGVADTKARLAELVEAGDLLPVTVEGWDTPGLSRSRGAPCRARSRRGPCWRRSIRWSGSATARIASSTSSIASRSTRRSTKRTYGYYVLPFLLGDRLVGRVDLKSDRANGGCWPCHPFRAGHRPPAGRGTAPRRTAPDGRLARTGACCPLSLGCHPKRKCEGSSNCKSNHDPSHETRGEEE